MKEASLLGKLGARCSASPARYWELERLGEAFRGKRGDCGSLFLFVCLLIEQLWQQEVVPFSLVL